MNPSSSMVFSCLLSVVVGCGGRAGGVWWTCWWGAMVLMRHQTSMTTEDPDILYFVVSLSLCIHCDPSNYSSWLYCSLQLRDVRLSKANLATTQSPCYHLAATLLPPCYHLCYHQGPQGPCYHYATTLLTPVLPPGFAKSFRVLCYHCATTCATTQGPQGPC